MKKILAIVLSFSLCVGAFAACQPKPAPVAETPATEAPATEAAPASEAAPAEASSPAEIKVAAIFGGAINDGNWNETQYNGVKKIEALGAKISYMENISDTDAAEAARTYAAEGYNLIYLTTNSYQDYCSPVAVDFPDVKFVQINGTLVTDNFISVRIADEEQGFMQGVIAALATKTGKVGFVGGLEINPIKLGSLGFQQGVDYVNTTYGTKVEAVRINTGSFTDVNKAKETAMSLIESGCDVVAPMANDASVGVMEAAEEKAVMAIGAGLGQNASAPTATQAIVVKDVSVAFDVTYKAYTENALTETTVQTFGANNGVVFLSDWSTSIDADVKTKSEEVMTKLAAGEIAIALK